VIRVDFTWEPFRSSDWLIGSLILNGQLIKDSQAKRYFGRLSVDVYDTMAVTLLTQCRLSEIAEHFAELTLPFPEAASDCLQECKFLCKNQDSTETLKLEFPFNALIVLEWRKPWSISQFISTLKTVVEDSSVPRLSNSSSSDLIIELLAPEETVQQVLEHWLPIIRDVLAKTEALLIANIERGALVALFHFAPEVKTACEQYLLYCVKFLQDLGISATADLQEQARGVLFTVTPESGPKALDRIREALDIYLRMPQSPDFDAEVTRHTDIAVQQYAANVLHFRSQLVLDQAVLETKNATMEALQAANLQYKQLLSANPQSQGQLAGSGTGNTQGDETILGGTVTITKYTGKGYQVNLPLIFRELRRRLMGER
jgi:hypothetical protein